MQDERPFKFNSSTKSSKQAKCIYHISEFHRPSGYRAKQFFFGKIKFNILTTFFETIKLPKKILKKKDILVTFSEK